MRHLCANYARRCFYVEAQAFRWKHVEQVSPPLGHLPDFEIKPLSPRSGADSSPAKGSSIEVTDGTPAACYQKNAEDYLQGDVSTSVMAQYGQQLFGTAQHTHSAHPAPDEDESGVEALVEWREDAPYG